MPADASEKMDDVLMDKLEPYDYSELKDFRMPYLAGYLAEKYDFDDEQLFSRVESKIVPYIDAYISTTISGYSSVSYTNKQIDAQKRKSITPYFRCGWCITISTIKNIPLR